jgi:two-component system response regulator DesR
MFRTAVRRVLKRENDFDIVAEAARGDQVIFAARPARRNLAVLDIEMPG